MIEFALAIILLHEAGKSLTHATRTAPWARKPLIPGLPISDAYHLFSGVQWPLVILCGYLAWGWLWWPWAILIIGSGIIWPLSKLFKPNLPRSEILAEVWWVQIARFLFRRR